MQKILWLLDNVNRIGHIFMEPYYIRNLFDNSEQYCTILIPASKSIANVAALNIIRRYFRIEVCEDMNLFSILFNNVRSNDVQFRDFIIKKWRRSLWLEYLRKLSDDDSFKPKRFSLTYDEIRTGLAIQGQMGIPTNARIVVLHNREPGYLPQLTYHSYRDAHIENFIPAVEYLTSRGYWVIRIGDPTMVPLPEMPQVFDLPFLPERTDFMDIWFSATCTCFIGNTSGPMLIPFVFGRPRLLVNFVGQPCMYGHPFDLYIPKLHYWRLKNRYLTLAESVRSDTGRAEDYENQGVEIQENSSDDIVDAVREMVYRVEGSFHVSEQMRILQTGYRRAMEVVDRERARTGEYNLHYHEPIEMGYQFLKKYPHLFATEQSSCADIQIHKRYVSCAPGDAFVTNVP
jgi:putative glycosyltransferase (TIGR04372 family)